MSMPRTLDEILVHSDELAARFENYEPNPGKSRMATLWTICKSTDQ